MTGVTSCFLAWTFFLGVGTWRFTSDLFFETHLRWCHLLCFRQWCCFTIVLCPYIVTSCDFLHWHTRLVSFLQCIFYTCLCTFLSQSHVWRLWSLGNWERHLVLLGFIFLRCLFWIDTLVTNQDPLWSPCLCVCWADTVSLGWFILRFGFYPQTFWH